MNGIEPRAVHGLPIVALHFALLALVACGGGDQPAEEAPGSEAAPAATDTTGAAPSSDPMMDEMMAHVARVQSMAADSIQAILPMHRQMVGNMLARMSADMRSMNMMADAAWNALVDSVRADVIRLPDLNPAELQGAMPAHLGRVTRLLDAHRSMMGRMGM